MRLCEGIPVFIEPLLGASFWIGLQFIDAGTVGCLRGKGYCFAFKG